MGKTRPKKKELLHRNKFEDTAINIYNQAVDDFNAYTAELMKPLEKALLIEQAHNNNKVAREILRDAIQQTVKKWREK